MNCIVHLASNRTAWIASRMVVPSSLHYYSYPSTASPSPMVRRIAGRPVDGPVLHRNIITTI